LKQKTDEPKISQKVVGESMTAVQWVKYRRQWWKVFVEWVSFESGMKEQWSRGRLWK